ncbi:MAG TPA: hypothetical protein VFQ61_10270 [Polyangiaceae bacterium]|nr:hypothetical protein [Polyangiaceae bacterium]
MKLRSSSERARVLNRVQIVGHRIDSNQGVLGRTARRVRLSSFAAGAAVLLGAVSQQACSGEVGAEPGTGGGVSPGNLGGSGGVLAAGGKAGASGGSTGGRSGNGGAPGVGGNQSAGSSAKGGSVATGGSSSGASTGGASGGASNGGAAGTPTGGSSSGGASGAGKKAADIAKRLGRKPNFLIGMGNDLDNDHSKDGAYTLGVTMDLHYAYMVGLKGLGGWPDWNAEGTFVNILADSAKAKGVTPMYTLYSMAAQGENNAAALTDNSYMQAYWDGAKLLFQRLGDFNGPALVQFEPDFWGFMQQTSKSNPSNQKVNVSALAPDCAALPNNLVGMGKCLVTLGRKYAPKAVLAFEVSQWADPDPVKVAKFLLEVGASDADLLTTDILDRDAGCFEAHTDPACQRNDGPWYWDETNKTSPNFHEYLAWIKKATDAAGLPILWWQTPFGVPSSTPGGTDGKYRDNRVKYIFEHVQEFIDAGGVGATFGVGSGNQTYITTDGGQFKNAVTKYYASPVPLP